MATQIASPVPPDMRSTLDAFKQEVFAQFNSHQIGTIAAYDSVTQKASVKLAVLRTTPTGQIPYPLLTDCPVYFPAGGDAYMTFPVAVGDPCLVHFNDRDIDNWFTGGSVVAPNSVRMHDLSDGIVMVGIRSLARPAPNVDPAAVSLWLGDTQITLVGGKVKIENATINLKDAVDALFTALTSWVNTGGSTPNPATVIALTAVQTQFDDLLA